MSLRAMAVVACALMLDAACGSSRAQTASADGPWALTLGAGTDNRSKAVSKSGNDGYAFGSAAWTAPGTTFYVRPAFQTVQAGGSHVEAEISAGWRPRVAGARLDLNLAYKDRLDADPGYDSDTWEATGSATRNFGKLGARLQAQYSPDAAGSTGASAWVEARLAWPLTEDLSGAVAVGRREQDDSPDYTGWNAGVTYAVNDDLGLDLRWYDTDAEAAGEQYRDALVAVVTYAF